MAFVPTSGLARSTSAAVTLTCAPARATSALALSRAMANGRWSIVNSWSPALTMAPSTKFTLSMKPDTRGRTSTDFTATKRPEYSSQVVMCSDKGCAIVTTSAGGSSAIAALQNVAVKSNATTGTNQRLKRLNKLPTVPSSRPDYTSDLAVRDRRAMGMVDVFVRDRPARK